MADISIDDVGATIEAPARTRTARAAAPISLQFATGGLFLLIGIFFAGFGLQYRVGSLHSMGPGMFPVAGGVLLGLIGIASLVAGLTSREALPAFAWRTIGAVVTSVLAFAATVEQFGLVVAAPLLLIGAVIATGRGSARLAAVLSVGLTAFSVVIFPVMLGVPLKVLP